MLQINCFDRSIASTILSCNAAVNDMEKRSKSNGVSKSRPLRALTQDIAMYDSPGAKSLLTRFITAHCNVKP